MTSMVVHQEEQEIYSRTIFGFWLYLMSDCILFATLFATYAVLHNNTSGGPAAHELFNLPYVLLETMVLLTSSFTSGIGMLAAHREQKKLFLLFFGLTFLLGATFFILEIKEFAHLVREGNSWQRSAFLSSYFTLVGTHGLHILSGLLWMIVLIVQVLMDSFTVANLRKLMCFSLFWHFLDIVWIFIFTLIYLVGAIV